MTDHNLAKIDQIAGEFSDEIRKIHPTNVKSLHGPNLPAYVNHHPGVDDVGRLSAEALAMSYEKAAKEIEDMGKLLIGEVKSSEATVLDVVKELERYKEVTKQAVDECKAAAESYRAEAKNLFDLVQARAMAADQVRVLCLEMASKIKTI